MARPGSTGGKSSTAGSLISHPSHGVAELLPRFEDLIPSSYFARTVFLEPTTKVITVHQTILWFWARLLPEVKRQTGLYGFAWQCQMSTCIQVAKYARMPGTGASRTIEVSFFAHFLRRTTFCPCEPWPVLQLCHLHTKGQNWTTGKSVKLKTNCFRTFCSQKISILGPFIYTSEHALETHIQGRLSAGSRPS